MNILKKYPLVSFFVLAYLITWSFQLTGIVLAQAAGMTLNNESNLLHFLDLFGGKLSGQQALVYLVFSLGMGPLIAAIVMTAVVDGRPGLRDLWARCTKWKVAWPWYVFVVAIPLALNLAALLPAALLTPGGLSLSPRLPLAQFFPFLFYMILFTGAVEEPGGAGLPCRACSAISQPRAPAGYWVCCGVYGISPL